MNTSHLFAQAAATWPRQWKRLFRVLCLIHLPAAGLLLAAAYAAKAADLRFSSLVRDPAAVFRFPPYIGVFSNIGVLIWMAATSVCFFVWRVLGCCAHQRRERLFILACGVISFLLLTDDFFMVHDWWLSHVFHISGRWFWVGYVLAMGSYLFGFRRLILERDYLLLVSALVFFAGSVFVDFFNDELGRKQVVHYLLEDGLKLFGILSWASYTISICRQAIANSNLAAKPGV